MAWIGLHLLDYTTVLLQALTRASGQTGQLFAGADVMRLKGIVQPKMKILIY